LEALIAVRRAGLFDGEVDLFDKVIREGAIAT
jgi:hypothetical protein